MYCYMIILVLLRIVELIFRIDAMGGAKTYLVIIKFVQLQMMKGNDIVGNEWR